ncbi:MAG: amino acid ABC transporter ATP-binding protein [Bacteriovorax sp.]|nr:amino acid ABC transporter ATP-binding protein [Bacteriovorax sp.]
MCQGNDKSEIIKLENVSKSFSKELILDDINFTFKAGGFYSIIGKSGCGKSTLLRCLNGLEILDQGRIDVNGIVLENNPSDSDKKNLLENCQKVRKYVGMVFQSFQLFPHMTLLDNVIKPQMIVNKINGEEARVSAMRFLNKVGLSSHQEKYPYQLSGGQQQRGSIARALALRPKIMLYDEPTSALDPQLVDEVHQVMRDIDHDSMTQIVVTHEMRFAREIADIVIYMDKGKIVEAGDPDEIFSNPKEELTRQFLRKFL